MFCKQMKANPDKCHILLRIQKEANFQIVNATIKYSRSKKLLGITLNNELKFDKTYWEYLSESEQETKSTSKTDKLTNFDEFVF